MAKLTLKGEPRKVLGRKVKKLRSEGKIPANIYGKKVKSMSITLDAKEFDKIFEEAGETTLIDLAVGTSKHAVLVRNVQHDPIEEGVLHVDFQQVDLKEKVTANVTIVLIGDSPAEKQGLGTVVQYLDEVEVEALPADLPENFEIDKSTLAEVEQAVLVSDLKVDKKLVEVKTSGDEIVVKVEPPTKEEEIASAPVEAVEGEAGATPAEGAPADANVGESPKEEPKK